MNIQEIRAQYPQYDNLSDNQLADALHSKFYSDMDKNVFYNRIGIPKEPDYNSTVTGGRKVLQGATVGLGNKIQAGIAALTARPFVKDRSISELYREARDELRAEDKAFSKANPKTALALELIGGLSTGAAGATKLAPKLVRAGKLGKAALLSGTGAIAGGVGGFGYSEGETAKEQLADTLTGAGVGAVLNPALAGTGNLLLKPALKSLEKAKKLTPYQKSVEKLKQFGIKLTTGQQTGSETAKTIETTLSGSVVGGKLRKTMNEGREQLQRKFMSMAGFKDNDIAEGLVTKEALDNAYDNLSRKYTKALGGKTVSFGDDFAKSIDSIGEQQGRLLVEKRQVKKLVKTIKKNFVGKEITGQEYQALRSELSELSRTGNDRLSKVYGKLKKAFDEEFAKSVGEKGSKLKAGLDDSFAQLKQLDRLYTRLGGSEMANGIVPLASLNREAKKSAGSREWKELTNAASQVFPTKTPNSGTATRALNYLIAGGGGAAVFEPTMLAATLGAGGGLYGLNQALARGVGSGVRNKKDRLIQSLIGTTPETIGIASSGLYPGQ